MVINRAKVALIWTPRVAQQKNVKKELDACLYPGSGMGCYPGLSDVFAPSCLISYATLHLMYVLSATQALEGWSNHFTIFVVTTLRNRITFF